MHAPAALVIASVLMFPAAHNAGAQEKPSHIEAENLRSNLKEIQRALDGIKSGSSFQKPEYAALWNDAAVFAKAIRWSLMFHEFPEPRFLGWTKNTLKRCVARMESLRNRRGPWFGAAGKKHILAYRSEVDGSLQPYALSLPAGFDLRGRKNYPLYVKLHGRTKNLNEVSFIHRHEGKATPKNQTWVQIDVYGRGNNAYRWAGETDVFEAMADVRKRLGRRLDHRKTVLWGFSMGGAGAWHLGLHHPSKWTSMGAGAGFVDFYNYQKKSQLPAPQHQTLNIYDAIPYAVNLSVVPTITYGGELDKQLMASKLMAAAAKKESAPLKMIVGPKMGHKFDPGSLQTFMAFHQANAEKGRATSPGLRNFEFVTLTPKYGTCEWLRIVEMENLYEPARVKVTYDRKRFLYRITTKNVRALMIHNDPRGRVMLDGKRVNLREVARKRLPDVYVKRQEWMTLDDAAVRKFLDNPNGHKRPDLQGPIDDAFMSPFLCVPPTGKPMNDKHAAYVNWSLFRFRTEWAKWMRGNLPVKKPDAVTENDLKSKHLVLFGDPGSNPLIAKVIAQLPKSLSLQWKADSITIGSRSFSTRDHAVCLIYPNPLNPKKYVVINSGHTIHEKDFRASNSWLFPRLGDVAAVKFTPNNDGGYEEQTPWAALFDSRWRLPAE